MSVYSYTTDSIEIFESPILYGLLSEVPAETIDAGTISVSANSAEINGYIVNTETVYPFGSAKVFGNSNSCFVKNANIEKAPLKLSGKITEGIRFTWVGSGTLFEIGGGQERIIAPWIGSSGPLRFIGLSINKQSHSYKEFVTVFTTADDFGLISSAVSSYQDFGSVSIKEFDDGIQDYGLITTKNTETSFSTPFGIKGSAQEIFKPIFGQIGQGSINISGESENQFIPSYDSFGLFNITGGERYSRTIINSSTCFILSLGSKQESAIFDYNLNSTVTYTKEDYQFITSSGNTEDYGLVTLPLDSGIDSYGQITNLTTEYPFGSIGSLGGHGIEEYKPTFGQIGQGSINISGESLSQFIPSYDSFGLFNIIGGERYSTTISNKLSIELFTAGSIKETSSFDYNTSSIITHSEEDFEFITSSGTTEDYGLITLPLDSGIDSYGYIVNLTTTHAFGSVGTFSGHGIEEYKPTFGQIGQGSINISGESSNQFIPSYDSFGLFNITGGERYSTTIINISAITLFTVGSKEESSTFDYNINSIVSYTEEDFEFITSVGLTEDCGSIALPLDSGIDSYGYIVNLTTTNPFGSIGSLGGHGVEEYEPTFGQIGQGSINISGESSAHFVPSYDSFGLFNVTGGDRYSTTINNISTSVIFTIGSKKEKAVFDYTTSSTVTYSKEDFEFITSSGNIEDYESVGLPLDSGIDSYGYITNITTEYPFGSIGFLSGSVEQSFINGVHIASGSLFALNGTAESISANTPESTALFKFQGFHKLLITQSYAGSGSLFTVGSKKEIAVFDYNTSSIVIYSEEDFEFITSSGTTEDYGLITLSLDSGIDSYGYINNLTTEYPFGSIASLGGHGVEEYKPTFGQIGQGSINISGESSTHFVPSYDSFGLFNVTGGDRYSTTIINVSTATLFTIGSKQESATFDYNTSSITIYFEEDFEFITSSGTTEDYGSVGLPLDSGIDSYGYITNLTTQYPFGSVARFSGHAQEMFDPSFAEIGFAEINISGEALTNFIPSYDSVGLFNVTGGERYSTTIINVSTATLFTIGSKKESAVFDYNTRSIVNYTEEDFEFITSSGTTEDYGSVSSELDSISDSYGYITNLTTEYPFGFVARFSGSASTPFIYRAEFESGSLFALNGVADSTRSNPPESTALLRIFGRSLESFGRASHVATGTLTYSGFVSGMKLTVANPVGGTAFVSGSKKESFAEGLYTGSGSLFTFTGASESVGANPPESTALFTLQGSAIQKNTESYVGVGNVYVSGTLVERNTESYIGSGFTSIIGSKKESFAEGLYTGSGSLFTFTGASESVGANPPESTALFNVSGRSRESFTEGNYNVTGTLTYSGFMTGMKFIVSNPVGGAVFVSGSAVQSQGDSYLGFGSLFGYEGAAESKTVDIPEFFGLFNIGGSSKESFTEGNYNTSGSAYINGYADNIKLSYGNVGSGFIYASGAVKDIKLSYGNVGSGSLFGYTGAAESKTVDIPEFFGLFNISGSKFEAYAKAPYIGSGSITANGIATETNTESYVGSGDAALSGISDTRFVPNWNAFGSLFGYGGAAESKTVDIPEFFGLFNVSGSKFEAYAKAPFVGSGSISTSGELTEKNTESYVGSGNVSISVYGTFKVVSNNISSGSVFVSGTKIEKQIDRYIGSGTLFGISGVSESVTVNLQFTTLFSFFGNAKESNTENYVGIGNATFGSSSKELFTPNNIGSGSLFAINGASESYAITERSSGLFEISGSKIERSANAFASDGQLSIISGVVVESHTEVYVASGSTSIDGSSINKFSPSIVGSGFAYTDGFAIERQTDNYVGFGLLFGFTGVVESVGVSPDDTFGLFNIFGSAAEKNTESYIGSGSTSISGHVKELFTPNNIGSGSAFVYGVAIEKQTDDYVGSGNLFGFYGAQESATINPDENVILFRFSGTLVERHTESYVGSGLETLSGVARTKFVPNWNGSGSINVIGFGEESHTEIYIGYGTQQISGFATEITKTASYQGYTEINISGYIAEKQSDAYIGSGSLFNIFGSEISASVNPPESTSLFVFEGSSTSSSRKQYTGFGSIFKFNGSVESTSKSTETTGLFEIRGSATVLITGKYIGSGSLFEISGSSESITYDLPEFNGLYTVSGNAVSSVTSNPPENTAQYIVSGQVSDIKLSHGNKVFGTLFGIGGASVVSAPSYISEKVDGIKILGYARESYARASHVTSGSQFITGISHIKFKPYEPPFTYVIII